jgi:hypothetical protein
MYPHWSVKAGNVGQRKSTPHRNRIHYISMVLHPTCGITNYKWENLDSLFTLQKEEKGWSVTGIIEFIMFCQCFICIEHCQIMW